MMLEPLLSEIKIPIEDLPHPVWILDSTTKNIICANRAAYESFGIHEPFLTGKSIQAFFKPRDNMLPSDITNSIDNETPFKVYLQPDISDPFFQPNPSNITGHRLTVYSKRVGHVIILFLKPVESPMVKDMISTNKEFMVICDQENRITEITPNVYLAPILQRKSHYGEKLSVLIDEIDIKRMLSEKLQAIEYVKEYDKCAIKQGTKIFTDSFRNLSNWKIDDFSDTLKGEDIGYLYLNRKIDLSKKDFAINCKISQKKPCRFSLIFNQQYPSKWDALGYSLGIQPSGTQSAVTLKKNTRFAKFVMLDTLLPETLEMRMIKNGGLISLEINGNTVLEYEDYSVIENRFASFGILRTEETTLHEYEIEIFNSFFDYSRTFNKPYRLKLKHVPDRLYDVSFITVSEWPIKGSMPIIRDAMYFKDVTEVAEIEEDRNRLIEKNTALRTKNYYGFVGNNKSIQKIFDMVDNIADTPATVLITGPTGSGKEVLARAIHARSNRRNNPFMKVDCASLPQSLLESELFGHEKGAFTGATASMKGRFELADGGTLFLDEIGNIDKSIQAKLLGFLQDHTLVRIGGTQVINVDLRIIAATNASLGEMIKNGQFREDLYYRLNVAQINLPSLGERADDIPILIDFFLEDINRRNGLSIENVSPAILEFFTSYAWPGNTRELYNMLLNIALHTKSGTITTMPELAVSQTTNHSAIIPEPERHRQILELAVKNPYLTIKECSERIPVSIHTLRKDIQHLAHSGKLVKQGSGRAVTYKLYLQQQC